MKGPEIVAALNGVINTTCLKELMYLDNGRTY